MTYIFPAQTNLSCQACKPNLELTYSNARNLYEHVRGRAVTKQAPSNSITNHAVDGQIATIYECTICHHSYSYLEYVTPSVRKTKLAHAHNVLNPILVKVCLAINGEWMPFTSSVYENIDSAVNFTNQYMKLLPTSMFIHPLSNELVNPKAFCDRCKIIFVDTDSLNKHLLKIHNITRIFFIPITPRTGRQSSETHDEEPNPPKRQRISNFQN